jgi:proliferating cell nuclear antigen
MKLTLTEPKQFREVIKVVNSLIVEAKIVCTKDNMQLVAMDPANVAMVVWEYPASKFTEYKIEGEQEEFALNMQTFKEVLRRVNDTLILELDKDKFKIKSLGKVTKEFNLPILELDEKIPKMPELDFKTKFSTKAKDLKSAFEDTKLGNKESLLLKVSDKVTLVGENEFNKAECELEVTNKEGEAESKYSLEYLEKMMAPFETVKVEFNKDQPIRLTYEEVGLKLILAPRVE